MPKKLSPEEATVMIIRCRLQQMEEAKMSGRDNASAQTGSSDDNIGDVNAGERNTDSLSTGQAISKQ